MNIAQLITDLTRLGIHIEAHGDRLRYAPRSAVTPDLTDRMKTHKDELLAILRRDSPAQAIDLTDAAVAWRVALLNVEGNPLFTPDMLEALRGAKVQWADDGCTEPQDRPGTPQAALREPAVKKTVHDV